MECKFDVILIYQLIWKNHVATWSLKQFWFLTPPSPGLNKKVKPRQDCTNRSTGVGAVSLIRHNISEPYIFSMASLLLISLAPITRWGWDKTTDMLPKTFSNAFFNEQVCILIRSRVLKFVSNGPVDNKSVLVQVMVWCRTSNKPLTSDGKGL